MVPGKPLLLEEGDKTKYCGSFYFMFDSGKSDLIDNDIQKYIALARKLPKSSNLLQNTRGNTREKDCVGILVINTLILHLWQ